MKALALLAALWVRPAVASDLGLSAATSGEFLRLGVGARALALGEAYAAVVEDAGAVYWNPAALTRVKKRSATFTHDQYLDSISLEYAAYAQNLDGYGAAGASFEYLSAGAIDRTDASGVQTGQYSPSDMAAALAYAYRFRETGLPREEGGRPMDEMSFLDGFSLGVAAKAVRAQISARAQTMTYDLGILSPEYLEGRLRAAAVLQNVGGVLRFDQEREPLPFAVKAGLAFAPADLWLCSAEGVVPRDGKSYAAAGLERQFLYRGGWIFAARAGFNSSAVGETGGVAGPSAGLGASLNGVSVDYAFAAMGSLGFAHQVTVSAGF